MIYPTLGLSIFAHSIVLGVGKVSNFMGFKKKPAAVERRMEKMGIVRKVFLSFFIALIIESVLLSVVATSFFAFYASVKSDKSNFNIVKEILYASTPLANAATNMVNNPSVETADKNSKPSVFYATPENWSKIHDSKNTSFFYYPAKGYNSPKSVKVQVLVYKSGKEGWQSSKINIDSSKQYNFSDYFISNSDSYISVNFQLSDGSYAEKDIAQLKASSQWNKTSAVFSPPPNAVSATVMHYLKSTGYLTTDEYSILEESSGNTSQISIQDPLPGAILSHSILIKSTATAGQVQFYVDGSPIENPVLLPPYQIVLDTTKFPDGQHVLEAAATDNQGNTSPKASVLVQFVNANILNPNILPNPSMENGSGSPDGWLNSQWGNNDAAFSYPVQGHTGKGAGITINNYVSGDAKWYFNDIKVSPGAEYLFSDFYKSDVSTSVVARYTLNDGSFYYAPIGSATPAADWAQFSGSFIVPDNAASATVFHLIQSKGSLYIDDFSVSQAGSNPFDQGMVSLNFDDGVPSFYNNGLPILNKYGIKSTDYIISGELGNSDSVTADQVLQLQSLGHEIGSHSKTHPDLTTLTEPQIIDEIANSKKDLESLGVNSIATFSYPYGNWNNLTDQIVKQSGYLGARTALAQDGGSNYRDGNPFLIRTKSVESGTTLSDIRKWIDQAIKDKVWIVLVLHGVDNTGGQYSTSPAKLNAICDYIARNNIQTITNSQGVYLMTHK